MMSHPSPSLRPVERASGYMPQIATPADEPNHSMSPPKPTAYASTPQSYPPCASAIAVSGILSKPAEMKPSASAVFQVGSGSDSTGIRDASATRHSRNSEPLSDPGSTDQSGLRTGMLTSS